MPKANPVDLADLKDKILLSADKLAKNPNAAPAAHAFFKPLSPFHSFTDGYLADDETRTKGETYHRSELSPHEDNKPEKFYKKKMDMGDRAHLGAYSNNFERNGDSFAVRKTKNGKRLVLKRLSESGDAALYDAVLQYKHTVCQSIANQVGDLKFIKAGFYNDYPCVQVYIKPKSVYMSDNNDYKTTDASRKAWVDFLISVYVGYVNFHAKQKGLDIELVRRSSFGFLSPTISVTSDSIRINVGVVPKDYADVLVTGLKSLNQALVDLHNPKIEKQPLPDNCFYGSKAHKEYLKMPGKVLRKTPKLDNIFQLLWQQVEKGGKTTVQNIVRTSRSRDGISAKVYECLESAPDSLFIAMSKGLESAVNCLSVGKKLTYDKSATANYPESAQSRHEKTKVNDPLFWDLVKKIIAPFRKHYASDVDIISLLDDMESSMKNRLISDFYKKLEILYALVLQNVAKKQAKLTSRSIEDGCGSDSEDEQSFEDETIYTKKLIVSNGMRAILATVLAMCNELNDFSLFIQRAYFEVVGALKLLKSYDDKTVVVRKPAGMLVSTAYLHDVNACVTDGTNSTSNLDTFIDKTKNKMLILDTTSSSTKQMHQHIEAFGASRASALFFVSSGLKNEQIGADNNAYGTIRLFAKNKALLNKYYKYLCQHEPRVNSPISHEVRRANKRVGATPTARSILNK